MLWMQVVTRLWATTDHQGVRLMAFLRLRQLAVAMPFPFIGNCLKVRELVVLLLLLCPAILTLPLSALPTQHAYLTFVRNAKFVGEHSLPALNLMINCLVDLFSLDAHSAYEHGFVYIRQLALHLRAAIVSQTKESVRNVYSWQYLNCLRVWTMVLCAQATEESSPMYPLVYPLVQVITGAVRLVPTAQHFPIRLHLVSLLNEVPQALACMACGSHSLLHTHSCRGRVASTLPLRPSYWRCCTTLPSTSASASPQPSPCRCSSPCVCQRSTCRPSLHWYTMPLPRLPPSLPP